MPDPQRWPQDRRTRIALIVVALTIFGGLFWLIDGGWVATLSVLLFAGISAIIERRRERL